MQSVDRTTKSAIQLSGTPVHSTIRLVSMFAGLALRPAMSPGTRLGLGFGASLQFRVSGLGFRVKGLGFRVLGFRVPWLGLGVLGPPTP